jgi:hypothetical protein
MFIWVNPTQGPKNGREADQRDPPAIVEGVREADHTDRDDAESEILSSSVGLINTVVTKQGRFPA